MRKRTQSREIALQILYQMDITGDSFSNAWENFLSFHQEKEPEALVKDFAFELAQGVSENIETINKKISEYAANWRLERMAVVDRNILRLGCFEIIFRNDIPSKVSINEAVEMAKKFSTIESAKFVNGILDKIKIESNR